MEASGAIIPSICSSMTRSNHHAGFSENPLSLPSRIFSLVYFNYSNYVILERNIGSNGVARKLGFGEENSFWSSTPRLGEGLLNILEG